MQTPSETDKMYLWYCEFYQRIRNSAADALFCERAYGKSLSQQGFMDMDQLAALLDLIRLKPGQRVLDLGCGNGKIAEYISDKTGAHITGVDYIPEAISQAQERTKEKRSRLDFMVGDMSDIAFPAGSFDGILAIDTFYFTDLDDTLRLIMPWLKSGGQLAAFYAHAIWQDPQQTPNTLLPDCTPLAASFRKLGLSFRAWDFTQAGYQLALRKQAILPELEAVYASEGNQFLYESRLAEADGEARYIPGGLTKRYLYQVMVRPGNS